MHAHARAPAALRCAAQVHDIEDLAAIGKRHQACPYFAARHLAESAELIFCPYSYLLDPSIRRSTKVWHAHTHTVCLRVRSHELRALH
jgi:Rad3-related DNA helicase